MEINNVHMDLSDFNQIEAGRRYYILGTVVETITLPIAKLYIHLK